MAEFSIENHLGNFGQNSWLVLYASESGESIKAAIADKLGFTAERSLLMPTAGDESSMFDPSGVIAEQTEGAWTHVYWNVGWRSNVTADRLAKMITGSVIAFDCDDNTNYAEIRVFEDGKLQRTVMSKRDFDDFNNLQQEMGVNGKRKILVFDGSNEEYLQSLGIEIFHPLVDSDGNVRAPSQQVSLFCNLFVLQDFVP